jgi:hypothetical protein
MADLKDTTVFINELVNTFPEIRDEVFDEDYEGLTSLQIGCFRRYAQRAIDGNDLDIFERCISFVETNINSVQFEIENSLVISFLGKLDFTKNENAIKLVPDSLKNIIEALANYYSNFSKDEKLMKFLRELDL